MQAASTAETSSVEVGRTTTRGPLRHGALGGPADGERPPVAAGLGPGVVIVQDFGAGGIEAVEERGRDLDDVRAEAIGDVGPVGVDRGDRGRLGHGEVEPGRQQFLLARLGEAGHLFGVPPPRPSPCRGR